MHDIFSDQYNMEYLGTVIDGEQCIIRHKPERVWRVYLASKALLARTRLSGAVLQVWAGHVITIFGLMRPGMASLNVCYQFIEHAKDRRQAVWPALRREIRVVAGLLAFYRSASGASSSKMWVRRLHARVRVMHIVRLATGSP